MTLIQNPLIQCLLSASASTTAVATASPSASSSPSAVGASSAVASLAVTGSVSYVLSGTASSSSSSSASSATGLPPLPYLCWLLRLADAHLSHALPTLCLRLAHACLPLALQSTTPPPLVASSSPSSAAPSAAAVAALCSRSLTGVPLSAVAPNLWSAWLCGAPAPPFLPSFFAPAPAAAAAVVASSSSSSVDPTSLAFLADAALLALAQVALRVLPAFETLLPPAVGARPAWSPLTPLTPLPPSPQAPQSSEAALILARQLEVRVWLLLAAQRYGDALTLRYDK